MAIYDIREYMDSANKMFESVLMESPGGIKVIKLAHFLDPSAGTSGRGSDKVWGLLDVNGTIRSFWGRRGKKLSSNPLDGANEASDKWYSKLQKGYKDVGTNAPGWVLKDGLPDLVSRLTDAPVEEEHNPADPTYSEFEPGGEAVEVEVEMPENGIEEADHVEAEHDYGKERSSKGRYNMDAYDYKGRAEHTGRNLRITNNYGDNPMLMPEAKELTAEEQKALDENVTEAKDFMQEYRDQLEESKKKSQMKVLG